MLVGNKKDIQNIFSQEKKIQKCLNYISKTQFESVENGQYVIDDQIKFNLFDYQTDSELKREWESHKKHIDLHFLISGKEKIFITPTSEMEHISYNEADDSEILRGQAKDVQVLESKQFILLLPNWAHKTGIAIKNSGKVRKIVFKIEV